MDLRKALAASSLAQAGWKDITPMARRDWIFSISSAKQTRKRAGAGSRKRATCLPLENDACVVFPV